MARQRLDSTHRAGEGWEATWTQYRHLLRDAAGEPIGQGEYRREAEGEFTLGDYRPELIGRQIDIHAYVPELSGTVLVTDAEPVRPAGEPQPPPGYSYHFIGQGTVRYGGHDPLDERRGRA